MGVDAQIKMIKCKPCFTLTISSDLKPYNFVEFKAFLKEFFSFLITFHFQQLHQPLNVIHTLFQIEKKTEIKIDENNNFVGMFHHQSWSS